MGVAAGGQGLNRLPGSSKGSREPAIAFQPSSKITSERRSPPPSSRDRHERKRHETAFVTPSADDRALKVHPRTVASASLNSASATDTSPSDHPVGGEGARWRTFLAL